MTFFVYEPLKKNPESSVLYCPPDSWMVRHLVVGWAVRVWKNLRFEILSYKISMDNFVKQLAHLLSGKRLSNGTHFILVLVN